MDTIKIDRKQTKMIAHRGLCGIERENTNAAFVAAGNRSYFGIETDVHKTADGQYAIIHLKNTSEITNGTVDINVEATPYEVVRHIPLPDLDGSTCRQDLRIPLLAEYVHICKKYDKIGVLELKGPYSENDLKEMIEIINGEEYLPGIIFISFVPENCLTLRKLLPQQPIQLLLAEEVTDLHKEMLYANRLDLDIYYGFLHRDLVDELHANHVKINCFTCNDRETAEKLIDMGIDYITTNILE